MAAIVDYSDSSEDDVEENDESTDLTIMKNTKKHNISKITTDNTVSFDKPSRKKTKLLKTPLPVPEEVLGMFGKPQSDIHCDPVQHSGRKRSFAHMEGNWATFVYVPYNADEHLLRLRDDLFKCLRPYGDFQPMDDHHISLSRTVSIRHHWIEPMLATLREGIQSRFIESSFCKIYGVHIYTNDEKTRSFLGLKIQDVSGVLTKVTEVVNETFSDFRLPPYYEDASYHLSVGWVLDDITTSLSTHVHTELQEVMDLYLEDEPALKSADICEICLKTGNKIFACPLSSR
ncbi:U6 snRNA phosphodiesterase 1-like [Liolophura sinensis]|uniref:U6 snRNA phosphodiesterase 1-like n=1 Tax=Liolophura sinensis TaxID=3198878 RepID=UPI0031588428